MKSIYELAVLYHPDLEIDIEKAEGKVTKIITDNGGEITNKESWGKRKTAYPVKKHEHAVYVFYTVSIEPTSVMKVESVLNITDEVIRFLIVKEDEKAVSKAASYKAKRKVPEGAVADDTKTERDSEGEK